MDFQGIVDLTRRHTFLSLWQRADVKILLKIAAYEPLSAKLPQAELHVIGAGIGLSEDFRLSRRAYGRWPPTP